MASPLQNLDREAMLLMYISDELGDEDRAAAENMLEQDATLRQRLSELRQLHESIADQLDNLDVHSRPASAESGIVRLLRHMRRHDAFLAERQANMPIEPARSWPRWVYPVASVAAVIFLILGLWAANVIELPGQSGNPDGGYGPGNGLDDQRLVMLDDELQRSFAISVTSSTALDEADQHFQALQSEDDDVSPPAM